ncbi:MAG: EamA family transporter [Desulfuromonadia bacterium]
MYKTLLVMIAAVTAGTVGDILLSLGMKELGDISAKSLRGMAATFVHALGEPKIVIGTIMLALFFFLWLAVLSWEDLSVALPLQALNYVIVALIARYWLGETVTPLRWGGIILVCIGVILIIRSSRLS